MASKSIVRATLTASTRSVARDRPVVGAAVQGLLAAVAIGSITSTASVGSDPAVVCGIVMGVAAALATLGGVCRSAAVTVFSAVGLIAFVPAGVSFVAGDMCGRAIAAPLRFVMLVLLVALAVLSFIARRLMVGKRPHASTGLSLFGALEILVAAATFIERSGSRQELVAMALIGFRRRRARLVCRNHSRRGVGHRCSRHWNADHLRGLHRHGLRSAKLRRRGAADRFRWCILRRPRCSQFAGSSAVMRCLVPVSGPTAVPNFRDPRARPGSHPRRHGGGERDPLRAGRRHAALTKGQLGDKNARSAAA